jgi:hypothetical protein
MVAEVMTTHAQKTRNASAAVTGMMEDVAIKAQPSFGGRTLVC